jgi:hypothetical protein
MSRAILLALILFQAASAAPKKVAVFVALCDNATQGILPVPAKIGDGDKPDANLSRNQKISVKAAKGVFAELP